MKNVSILPLSLFISFLIQSAVIAQVKFDHDKFSNAKRKHKSLVEVNSENILRYNVKNIQIIACTGEFEMNEAFLASEFNGIEDFSKYFVDTHGSTVGNEIGENYPETVANAVYKMNQKILMENGLKSVSKKNIVSSTVYQELGLSRTQTSVFNCEPLTAESNKLLVSASQMKALPKTLGYDAQEEFYKKLAKIGNETESAAEMKIHFKVKIDESGNPVLTEYSVLMDTWLDSFRKGKETVYKWKVIDAPVFTLKKEIAGNVDLKGQDGKIDMKKFDIELMNMLKDVTEMFSYALSDQFIKYQ